jgi:hypothetical protein
MASDRQQTALCNLRFSANSKQFITKCKQMVKTGQALKVFFGFDSNNASTILMADDYARAIAERKTNSFESFHDLYKMKCKRDNLPEPSSVWETSERFFGIPGGHASNLPAKANPIRTACGGLMYDLYAEGCNYNHPMIFSKDHGLGIRPENVLKTIGTFNKGSKSYRTDVEGRYHNGSARILAGSSAVLIMVRFAPEFLEAGEEDVVCFLPIWREEHYECGNANGAWVTLVNPGTNPDLKPDDIFRLSPEELKKIVLKVPAHLVQEWIPEEVIKVSDNELVGNKWIENPTPNLLRPFRQGLEAIQFDYDMGNHYKHLLHGLDGNGILQFYYTQLWDPPMPFGLYDIRPTNIPDTVKRLKFRTVIGNKGRIQNNYKETNPALKRIQVIEESIFTYRPDPNQAKSFTLTASWILTTPPVRKTGTAKVSDHVPIETYLEAGTQIVMDLGLGQAAITSGLDFFSATTTGRKLKSYLELVKKRIAFHVDLKPLNPHKDILNHIITTNRTITKSTAWSNLQESVINTFANDQKLLKCIHDEAKATQFPSNGINQKELEKKIAEMCRGFGKFILVDVPKENMRKDFPLGLDPNGPSLTELSLTQPYHIEIVPDRKLHFSIKSNAPDGIASIKIDVPEHILQKENISRNWSKGWVDVTLVTKKNVAIGDTGQINIVVYNKGNIIEMFNVPLTVVERKIQGESKTQTRKEMKKGPLQVNITQVYKEDWNKEPFWTENDYATCNFIPADPTKEGSTPYLKIMVNMDNRLIHSVCLSAKDNEIAILGKQKNFLETMSGYLVQQHLLYIKADKELAEDVIKINIQALAVSWTLANEKGATKTFYAVANDVVNNHITIADTIDNTAEDENLPEITTFKPVSSVFTNT